jgi:hypothetical protein
MVRVILGIIKGGLIGAGLGYAAMQIGVSTGPVAYVTYAAVGFLVGLVCGKAVWRQETMWTPALKGLFGAAVCAGLYWLGAKFLGGLKLEQLTTPIGAADRPLLEVPLLVAPALAIVYGIFVEIDDGERKAKTPPPAGPAA